MTNADDETPPGHVPHASADSGETMGDAADQAPTHPSDTATVPHPSTQDPVTGKAKTARSAFIAIVVATVLAVVFAGDSVTPTGEDMPAGFLRNVVVDVGKPTGKIARALPFAAAADSVEGWFKKDPPKAAVRTVTTAPVGGAGGAAGAISPSDFDRRTVQDKTPLPALKSLLITGDSMSQPLDVHLARDLAPAGITVTRDPHIGSGISKTFPVDWVKLAPQQIADHPSDVVVVLLGANEGFGLGKDGKDACCGAAWTADYATRVRQIAQAYFDGGAKQIFWLALPGPRGPRAKPSRAP